MSNFRIFCWGWVTASFVLTVLNWFGLAPEPGLSRMVKILIVSVGWGIAAVALFGDRTPSHD